jgi:hypothetical protein
MVGRPHGLDVDAALWVYYPVLSAVFGILEVEPAAGVPF